jgi:PIN domain nuclease of toxin-antitoxin system
VKLLLDTHALLWALAEPERLTEEAREAVRDGRNEVLVSAASVWEISIKQAAGKLRAPDDLLDVTADAGFGSLPILARHALAAGTLSAHHRDPFDRMLIAQAREEALTIVTRDQRFRAYDVELLLA